REGREVGADDEAVRYYTLAEEVAAAFMFLMREHVRGIVHVSASDSSTKYGFLRRAAEATGWDPGLVVAAERSPDQATRPHDSHLATGRYDSLGGLPLTGYRRALEMLSGGSSAPHG
ncbi:MAG: sugar nucleotide-binding protein, partial [Candidatus Brocadiaceae bacterium]